MPEADSDFLSLMRDRFKAACDDVAEQLKQEEEDLAFQIPERQWTEEAIRLREGDGDTAPRPIVSIDKITQPIQLVLNQAANARLGVEFHPVSEKADPDIAEVKQGIYRRVERDSNAADGRLWALERAVKCGRGAYRVNVQEDEDSEHGDMEIVIERIQHQSSVYWDPAAVKPDRSDAQYAFVATWVPKSEYKRRYGKSQLAGMDEWGQMSRDMPQWVRTGGNEGALVVEYWYKEKGKLFIGFFNGNEAVEEPKEWATQDIPLIPVFGRELQPFEGRRIYYGMIRLARDPQRLFNFAAATLIERMQLEPKAPWVGYEGQFEGHEKEWRSANFKNPPYLEAKATDFQGKPLPLPVRSEVNTQGMSVAMAALQEASMFINDTLQTGFDPSIGRLPARERSGKAIRALQDQLESGTSHFIVDFARNSMGYEAKVIGNLMASVYGSRPGRITQVLGEEDEPDTVMLGQPFVMDPNTGRPMPAPGNPRAKEYDLSRGRYSVTVSVGRSRQTRMEEGRMEMAQILQAQSELWPILGATFFRFHDAPWAKEVADILKRYRDQKFPNLTADEDEEQRTPEETAARLQAAEDFIKQQNQQIAELTKQLETDQAKQQAQIQGKQLDALTRLKIAEMNSQTGLQETEMNNQTKLLIQAMSERFDEQMRRLEQAQEVLIQRLKGGQESRLQEREQAHEVATKAADLVFGPAQGPLTTDETIR